MGMTLYDLAGDDEELRFSPYCWRAKKALAHKRLEYETIPWRHGETEALAFSGQSVVPVLVDGETVVGDSWKIARYLEERYPDRPSLALTPETLFLNHWTDTVLHPAMMRVVMLDVFRILRPGDREYFRATREQRIGMTLEAYAAEPEKKAAEVKALLKPLRLTLESQPFFGGERPAYSDYIVFGAFQWQRAVSKVELLEPGEKLAAWREKIAGMR